jgi:succinate dehydrogenase/fumarate reductase flavoprotein subunit
VVEDNLSKRGVRVFYESPVVRLIGTPDNRIVGVRAKHHGRFIHVKARKGVILSCGGFEADEELKKQFWPGTPVVSAAFRGNTGDGIRMAQEVGASLWHMWNFHGSYGLLHTNPDYTLGIRPKRLPDWIPGHPLPSGMEMAWIVVDQQGRRYMNEYPPYLPDVGHRSMQWYDTETQSYPRIPSYMIFDDDGRKLYPVAMPTFNDTEMFYEWSDDNLGEVENGILKKVETIEEIALELKVEPDILKETVHRWNGLCVKGTDDDFGRPGESMIPIQTPPYYYAKVWPVVSNTHGGPVHDENWQVLDAFGDPIPALYEAGELGGIFGFLYLAGGNLAECYIGGWTAARHAVKNEPWK